MTADVVINNSYLYVADIKDDTKKYVIPKSIEKTSKLHIGVSRKVIRKNPHIANQRKKRSRLDFVGPIIFLILGISLILFSLIDFFISGFTLFTLGFGVVLGSLLFPLL